MDSASALQWQEAPGSGGGAECLCVSGVIVASLIPGASSCFVTLDPTYFDGAAHRVFKSLPEARTWAEAQARGHHRLWHGSPPFAAADP